ncbi:hypothetical protein Lalb_Chr02g0156001 [Lupinus albus]|uniref:Membrane magnesium transporter n=1 Tax=Lupinus albus TaxID=3870 RepID=A0A6A4QXZ5_LUPAL|nr:hypothetical protein Lalb_Chr02g0156001 [Lupinus albus]
MGLGLTVGFLGVLVLFHAAYSTIQCKLLRKSFQGLLEECCSFSVVVVELFIGLVICIWASLTLPGKFLSIHSDSDENR